MCMRERSRESLELGEGLPQRNGMYEVEQGAVTEGVENDCVGAVESVFPAVGSADWVALEHTGCSECR